MQITGNNDHKPIYDRHFKITCPHCQTPSNISAIAIPRYELAQRLKPIKLGIGYMCNNCKEPVFLRFRASYGSSAIDILEQSMEEVEFPLETFELQYLPDEVKDDFSEALTSYSTRCYNAFAAMCRRTIQSAFTELGATAENKVKQQLKEIKEDVGIDDETYALLMQIIISGHDGAHPNLPKVNSERAAVLLVLMKDVLTQIFVRQAKIKESMVLRNQAIADKKDSSTD